MNRIVEQMKRTALLPEQTALWYLGQESIVCKHHGAFLGVDLYLTDYVDKNSHRDPPWVRSYPSPVAPEELDCLDVVLCTHPHGDHMDPWTLPKLAKANEKTVFVVPAPSVRKVVSFGIEENRILPARADVPMELAGFRITPIPAAHTELHTDANGDYIELSYLIETEACRLFHAGDLCMYEGLMERLDKVDVAALPVNGRDHFRTADGIIGNLTCEEAAMLAEAAGMGMVIPMHHDLYRFNGVPTEAFVNAMEKYCRYRPYHIFAPGERYIFSR